MDIPIVRWTDPKTQEAYEDKVKFLNCCQLDFILRSTVLTSLMQSQKTSLQEKAVPWMTTCMSRTYRLDTL